MAWQSLSGSIARQTQHGGIARQAGGNEVTARNSAWALHRPAVEGEREGGQDEAGWIRAWRQGQKSGGWDEALRT